MKSRSVSLLLLLAALSIVPTCGAGVALYRGGVKRAAADAVFELQRAGVISEATSYRWVDWIGD